MLDWLAQRAQISPDSPALIFGDQVWAYADLDQEVSAMASGLAAAGVGAAQHVAMLLPNSPQAVMLIHALARLGAVLVPLNRRLTTEELNFQIEYADCAYLVYSSKTAVQAAELNDRDCQQLAAGELLAQAENKHKSASLDLDALQGIVFTSGTQGQPKGAMLTFGNHFWSAAGSSYKLGTLPDDRWLLCMPLYHVGGLAIIFRCCLYGTAVVLQNGFDPEKVDQALDQQSVTLVSLVPTMLHRLLEHRGERPFPPGLRHVLLGGAAANPTLVERCIEQQVPLALTYGLTEAASQVATAIPEDVRRAPESVGQPLMFTQVKIVGRDGQTLPQGEIGEIAVSGPTVMRGYYQDRAATDRALHNGWLRTGDLGRWTAHGLEVVQRRIDLIISGGENVYPSEIEAVLTRHPSVADACVVGLPDEEWGQRVAAAIEARQAGLTGEELEAYCRQHLAAYKVPRRIEIVDSLPRTASGKMRRGAVATQLANLARAHAH